MQYSVRPTVPSSIATADRETLLVPRTLLSVLQTSTPLSKHYSKRVESRVSVGELGVCGENGGVSSSVRAVIDAGQTECPMSERANAEEALHGVAADSPESYVQRPMVLIDCSHSMIHTLPFA